ncbi:MAG: nitroreductase family protein [Nitrospirota bacterium]
MIKDILKKLLPVKVIAELRTVRSILSVLHNYWYDASRCIKYSLPPHLPETCEQLEARIIAHYHVIEKGLSLKEPRLMFGKDIIESLFLLLRCYKNKGYDQNRFAFQTAVSVLWEYIRFHEKHNCELKEMRERLQEASANLCQGSGGALAMVRKEVLHNCSVDFDSFARSRYSIRNFSDEDVPVELIYRAVAIAQKAPSSCNRQPVKVYIIRDERVKAEVLNLQTGNRGFGYLAKNLLIVTADLHAFNGVHERNQSFIDGGMFAMSLLYALHHVGLASCALNWGVTKEKDVIIRRIVGISSSENIVLIIAVGHYPELFSVAVSSRKNLEEIVIVR